MRKVLLLILCLLLCFMMTSFSSIFVLDKGELGSVHTIEVSKQDQIVYAIYDEIERYSPMYTDQYDISLMSLASKCIDSMQIDYDSLEQAVASGNSIQIKALSVDMDKLIFINTEKANYSSYEAFMHRAHISFVDQLDSYLDDIYQYTYEHTINVYIEDNDMQDIKIRIDNNDMNAINDYFYNMVSERYQVYQNSPDIQGVNMIRLLDSISAQEMYSYIDNTNPNVFDQSMPELYTSYINQYINNLVIGSVVFTDSESKAVAIPSQASNIVIKYSYQDSSVAIESAISALLGEYIHTRQVPKDRAGVIRDMAKYINDHIVSSDYEMQSHQMIIANVEISDSDSIVEALKSELMQKLFYNMQSLGSIVEEKWTVIQENYFYTEREVDETVVFYNAFEGSDYRVLEVQSPDDTDSYIKVHMYDTEDDVVGEAVFTAYIKDGETIQTALPEGDYIFKYATGDKWYGVVYMFSDTGIYRAVTQPLEFHEPYLKTTIELGDVDDSNLDTTSEELDGF